MLKKIDGLSLGSDGRVILVRLLYVYEQLPVFSSQQMRYKDVHDVSRSFFSVAVTTSCLHACFAWPKEDVVFLALITRHFFPIGFHG